MTNNILQVSQLNQDVRLLLERSMGTVWLVGEISNLATPFSGHWYFSLKDSKAQVRCAMFKNSNRRVLFKPENGMQVLIKARITLYEPRGEYQVIADSMQPEGDGAMQLAFEQSKFRLAAEGLFAEEGKRTLPSLCNKLGIITSLSGAALHDVLSVLQRRAPHIEVIIYPTLVQGDKAATSIIDMIEQANQRQEVDLLLLTRGGGSKEDLWCFNDEALARAIYQSELMLVSAVGHEIDSSICDYVADLRCATPSAAAEVISNNSCLLQQRLQHLQQALQRHYQQQLKQQQQALLYLTRRLHAQAPQQKIEQHLLRLDDLNQRLHHSVSKHLQHRQKQTIQLQLRLLHSPLLTQLQQKRVYSQQLKLRLTRAMQHQQEQQYAQLAKLATQLDALSPLQVLQRGYSMVSKNQQIVSSKSELKVGDEVELRFKDGERKAQIL